LSTLDCFGSALTSSTKRQANHRPSGSLRSNFSVTIARMSAASYCSLAAGPREVWGRVAQARQTRWSVPAPPSFSVDSDAPNQVRSVAPQISQILPWISVTSRGMRPDRYPVRAGQEAFAQPAIRGKQDADDGVPASASIRPARRQLVRPYHADRSLPIATDKLKNYFAMEIIKRGMAGKRSRQNLFALIAAATAALAPFFPGN